MIDYIAIENAIIAAIQTANTASTLGLVAVEPLTAATADYESLDGASVRIPGAYVAASASRPFGNVGTRGTTAEGVAITVVIITSDVTTRNGARRAAFPVINALVPAVLAASGLDGKPEYQGFDLALWRDGACVHELKFTVKTLSRQ